MSIFLCVILDIIVQIMAAMNVPSKIVLKSTTKISLNER